MWEDTSTESGESESSPMVTISEESLGGHECKVGDTLTFKVVSKEDGQVGLQMEGYGGGGEHEGEMMG